MGSLCLKVEWKMVRQSCLMSIDETDFRGFTVLNQYNLDFKNFTTKFIVNPL